MLIFTACPPDPPANVAPTATAGTDITITLPTSTVNLDGSASTDADGSIATYTWTQTSGADTTIVNPDKAATQVTGLTTAGEYVYQLEVTDDDGDSHTDTIKVTVNPAANVAPTAVAGTDITITLPTSTVNVDGSGSSDTDGTIAAYAWTQTSGADTTIVNPDKAATQVTGLTTAGEYVYQLEVTDDDGDSHTDTIKVTVNPAANVAPTAVAGSDITITLPTSTVNVDGSGSADTDGTIAAYAWTQTSGAATTIADPAQAATQISGLTAAGEYVYQLEVTDDDGAKHTDTIKVTVNPAANVAPVAAAGTDQTIYLPDTTTATLSGAASADTDGTIAAYAWAQTAGAATTIVSPSAATTVVNGLTAAGDYTYSLTVTDDDGASHVDEVKITVVAPVTVTKDVTVGAINFTRYSTSLSFAPSYTPTGGWGDFSAADITYTLTDDMGHTTESFLAGVVNAALYAPLYIGGDTPRITQTFLYNGVSIGSRSVILEIADPGGAPYINGIYDNMDGEQILTEDGTKVPAVTLDTLSKQVSAEPQD
ncbi:MAG: PKD domain-containing protein [Spirochaetaceae bacterium]|jgi:chitodextrinase|nr:PKD domain-containing protein [Spirochaetaceae bacterium]